MAGAGQPWYMPVLWPVAHVTTAVTKPKDDKAGPNVSLGKLDLVGHLTAFCAALRSFSLAYVAIYGSTMAMTIQLLEEESIWTGHG